MGYMWARASLWERFQGQSRDNCRRKMLQQKWLSRSDKCMSRSCFYFCQQWECNGMPPHSHTPVIYILYAQVHAMDRGVGPPNVSALALTITGHLFIYRPKRNYCEYLSLRVDLKLIVCVLHPNKDLDW